MGQDSLWHMSHPRNAAIERAFEEGAADNGSRKSTWPAPYGDTMRGFDRELNAEYLKARFAFAPVITSVLERGDEAIRELTNGEIRQHSDGKLNNLPELLAWREQQRKGPKR